LLGNSHPLLEIKSLSKTTISDGLKQGALQKTTL